MRKEPQTKIQEADWLRILMLRMFRLWGLKMTGTIFVMWGFFKAYFWALRNSKDAAFMIPVTAVDDWINFAPWAVLLYGSLWLYVGLLPAVYKYLHELSIYVTGVLLLSSIGVSIFFYWPTTIQIPEALNRSQHLGFSMIEGLDSAGNACPSLHVAFAVFTAIGFQRVLKEVRASRGGQLFNLLWSAGICYSTIAIRQHVFWDVVAGGCLGTLVAIPTFFTFRSDQNAISRIPSTASTRFPE